ncbi:hypothetical protein [Nonomuraea ceibae]|uniref:hypothetical protein n=1 Tax=Nonomuraea ceibae TaxID=1935170 RepID=UPI001C5EA3B0|nr:hypothetical protein [Nonomuraea ceibae]
MTLCILALATALTLAPTYHPPASSIDPPGVVMGVKYPSRGMPSLMVGVLDTFRTYERTVTPAQVGACTRWPHMAYPACLSSPTRTDHRPS